MREPFAVSGCRSRCTEGACKLRMRWRAGAQLVHGILLGEGVPFPFSDGLAGFYSLRREYLTPPE
jgi:hypothetical protein